MKRIVVKLSPLLRVGAAVDPQDVALSLVSGPILGGVDPDVAATAEMPTFTETDDSVSRGRAMMAMLQSCPPVQAALSLAFANDAGADPVPVYLQTSGDIDALPWEQLYDGVRSVFCALDRRWPIGRMAGNADLPIRFFSTPFRFVAVIGAALRGFDPAAYPGVRQLEYIAAAVGALPWAQLHVISGHDAVLGRAAALQSSGARISCEPIGRTGSDVAAQIAKARPHVLHVFSHGAQIGGMRILNLANTADVYADADRGSVNLMVSDLAAAILPSQPWLVVLAACGAAEQRSAEEQAFARELVMSGVPAVVGMRRRVDVVVMNRVTEALYGSICERVSALPASGAQQQVTLDWSPALTAARTANLDPSAEHDETWSDPVLYANAGPLQVVVAPQTDAQQRAQGQRDEWRRFLAQLTPDTPEAVRHAVEEQITRLDDVVGAR